MKKQKSIEKKPQPVPATGGALGGVVAVDLILTVICAIKGNPAWRGTLSLLFFAMAFALADRQKKDRAKPYAQAGLLSCVIGIGLLVWFCVI